MKDKIKIFIKTEKDLSRKKILMLEKVSKPYAKRMIQKEKDFIRFGFNKIKFKNINECRDAVRLYKISKTSFMEKYCKEKIFEEADYVLSKIKKKISNIKIKTKDVDGFPFKSLKGKNLYKEDGSLRKIVEYKITNLKVLLCYSHYFIKKNGSINIDKIVNGLFYNIYFNDWFEKYIELFEESEKPFLSRIFDSVENLFEKKNFKKLQLINKTENTDLIITSLPHRGYEKSNILYIELNKKNGKRINVKKNKFSNFPIDKEYYKCILVKAKEVEDIDEIDLDDSILLCTLSRRNMEHKIENLLWLKFTLEKIIN